MPHATIFELPTRLSDATHSLAQRSLDGEFAKTLVNADFTLADRIDIDGMSESMRCANSLKLIAENAPIRIITGEKIVGSATYREATMHAVPIYNQSSVSHTTLGFDRALKIGYKGLRAQIEERLTRGGLDDKGVEYLNTMLICLDAASIWHGRYINELEKLISESTGDESAEYEAILESLRNVPENPPTSFREAVQSLWFVYGFLRLCGNWPGIGRIDQMLGSYLADDLASGKITLDEAREVLAHFWIKGTEWSGLFAWIGGDAQFYQNIILGGIDAEGNEVTNDVTYLVLDIIEELRISDFPVAVRINRNTPERLLRKIAETQRQGGGVVSVYNEEVMIDALHKFGYPLDEARCFTNDGCWEPLIPGKTCFGYYPFDILFLVQDALGLNDTSIDSPAYPDFESLYAAFHDRLVKQLDEINIAIDTLWDGRIPSPIISMFIDDCIERGRDYYDNGPKYTVVSPHAGGMADAANGLLALKRLVFDEKLMPLTDYISILRANWEGQENLRKLALNRLEYYGNDNDESDAMVQRIFDDFTSIVAELPERNGILRPAGISTFGREIGWIAQRRATADGHVYGDILATNFSPSPGTDKKGPTAALKSFCKMDFTNLPGCATLELKMLPASVKGEAGLGAITAMLRSFVKLGGSYMNIDVLDSSILKDAQLHPERYRNLAVRISGWCARFVTLEKEWQDMVINRTQQII
ncbi:MAG: pyruvate formate lyase family protein [Armatimonadota bacterium]